VVARCLAKDPEDRWQSARDLMQELRWVRNGSSEGTQRTAAKEMAPGRRWIPWIGFAFFFLSTIILAVVLLFHFRGSSPANPVSRLQIPVPDGLTFNQGTQATVSPEGQYLSFAAVGPDRIQRMYVRALDALEVKALTGTEIRVLPPPPYWSYDGRSVFF